MKPRKLSLTEQVENLELANQALKKHIVKLEEKIHKYEKALQHCPRFQAEQRLEEDGWDGLEESDFADDWEDDEDFDDDDFDEDDFEDEDFDDDDFDDFDDE